MKKITIYSEERAKYLQGQYSLVRSAITEIARAAKSQDIDVTIEDIQSLLDSPSPEETLYEIFLRPVINFFEKYPGYPKSSMAEMKRPLIIAANQVIPALLDLNRFHTLGLPLDNWEFHLERASHRMGLVCEVAKNVLDEHIQEQATITLTEEQGERLKVVESLCAYRNAGFEPTSFIDYNSEKSCYVINQNRLLNEIMKG